MINLRNDEKIMLGLAVLLAVQLSTLYLGNYDFSGDGYHFSAHTSNFFGDTLKQYGMLSPPPLNVLACGFGFGALSITFHVLITRKFFRNLEPRVWNHWSLVVALATIFPLLEELLFRGVVQSAVGILPASILFAVAHMPRARIKQMGLLMIPAGLLLGSCMILASNNLWAPFIAHVCLNLFVSGSGYLICKDWTKSLQYLDDGNFESAIELANRALSKASFFSRNEASMYVLRAHTYLAVGKFSLSVEDALQAIKIESTMVDAHLEAPYSLAALKRFDEGNEAANAALALDASNIFALNFSSWCKLNIGETEAALQVAEKTVAAAPDSPLSYECRGVCLLVGGQVEAALRDFSKAIELAPQSAENFWYRGLAFKRLNLMAESKKDHARAQELGCSTAHWSELLDPVLGDNQEPKGGD